jgi:hypothetical protein
MGNPYNLSLLFGRTNRKVLYSDLSVWMLVLSNLLTIIWAIVEGWSVGVVMWSYWSQSVSIGILWFFKILCLKDFSTEGIEIPVGRPVAPTTSGKIECALSFIAIYGLAHYMYSGGLRIVFPSVTRDAILPIAILFFLCQCFSFFYNRKWKEAQKSNMGNVMLFPYLRIIPMHLSFIVGGFVVYMIGGTFSSRIVLVIFMLLKTFADVYMHAVERRGFGDKTRSLRRRASARRAKARSVPLGP